MISDIILRLVAVGESYSGKTALITRYTENTYSNLPSYTIGVDFNVKTITVEKNNAKIQTKLHIWDTAGQERFRCIAAQYFRNVDGILVVFDVSNRESFNEAINIWIPRSKKEMTNTDCKIILIGNKSDLESVINIDEIMNFCNKENILYIETSAKTGHNVTFAIDTLVKNILSTRNIINNTSNTSNTTNTSNTSLLNNIYSNKYYKCSYF